MAKEHERPEFPPQHQDMPGNEEEMVPRPMYKGEWYAGSGKLAGRKAVITGGDSGIGRSVAVFFAREGADISVVYLSEHNDAQRTKEMVEKEGTRCITMAGDIGDPEFSKAAVRRTVSELGGLNIVVNNAAFQPLQQDLESLDDQQLERTFRTNIYSYFYITREAVRHLDRGDVIINTSSVTAYKGSHNLLDYSATKGAEITLTRSLSRILAEKGIRVNAVAPGPVWTPLTVSTYPEEYIPDFGRHVPMGRGAQPEEIAPCYVFLASRDSSYMTGQVLHPNGGEMVGC